MNNRILYFLLITFLCIHISYGQTNDNILRIKKDNKWGAINPSGQIVIPPKYEFLGDFNEFGVALFRENNKYGAINLQNQEVLPAIYDDVRIDSTEGIIVAKAGKWGILNLQGKTVFSVDYDKIAHAPHKHFWLWKGNKKGVANSKGKEVVPVKFDEVMIFSPQRFIVQLGDSVGLLDDIQGEVLPVKYDSLKISSTIDKTIRVYIHGKSGLTSWEGKEIIEPAYKNIKPYPSHPYYITFNEDRHVGLIEKHGLHVLDTLFRDVKVLPNGRIMAKQLGSWIGFMPDGKQFTKQKWENFEYLSEDYLILKKNETHAGLYAFALDSLILPPEYLRFEYAFENYLRAFKSGGSYLIHPDGQILTSATYDSYIYLGKDLFGIKNEKNWGIMSKDGKVLAEPHYEKIYAFPKTVQITLVKNYGKFGLINTHGKLICETNYDKIEVFKNTQRAKAYQGEVITIFEFNDAGNIVDQYKFQNVLSVSVKSTTDSEKPMRFNLPSRNRFVAEKDETAEMVKDATKHKDIGKVANFGPFRNKWIRIKGTWVDTEDGGHYRNLPLDFFNHNIARVLMQHKYALNFGYITKKGAEVFVIPMKNGRRVMRKRIGFLGSFHDGLMRINLDGRLGYQINDDLNRPYSLAQDMSAFQSYSLSYALSKARILTPDRAKVSIPICSGGTWGYLDKNGKIAIPPIYEFVQNFQNGKAIAKKKGKWGVINAKNETIIPFEYDFIDYLPGSNGQFFVLEIHGKKHGFVNALGQDVVPTDHDELNHFSEGIASVKSGHHWGFVDHQGRWIAKPTFLAVRDFSDGLAPVRTKDGWGYINKSGNIVIEPQFIRAGEFHDGLAPVRPKKSKSGYINTQGEFVIEPQFDRVTEFKFGRAMVKPSQKDWGMINTKGEYILPTKFKRLEFAKDSGFVLANQNYMWGLCDLSGKKLTGFKYKKILPFSEGLAAVQIKKSDASKSTYGYIDKTGKLVIQHQFKNASDFNEGKAIVSLSRRDYFFINTQGEKAFDITFQKATPFSEGKAIIWLDDETSKFINDQGEDVLVGDFIPVMNFKHGRAVVHAQTYNKLSKRVHAGLHAIDSLGNLVPTIDMHFHTEFHHGVSFAKRNGKFGLVDINGVPLSSFKYDGFGKWHNGLCHVYVNRIKGIANLDGNMIAAPKFHYIRYLGNGLFRMERADEIGYISNDGTWLWEIKK